jgi:hypothetical protein
VRKAAEAASRGVVAVLVLLVRLYQGAVSPLVGPCCKHSPSCSEYAVEALTRHGMIKGLVLAGWRVLRCNPWSGGGVDPVPPRAVWRRAQ